MLKRQASGVTSINNNKPFAPLLAALFTAIIVLYAVCVRYADVVAEEASNGAQGEGMRQTCAVLTVLQRGNRSTDEAFA